MDRMFADWYSMADLDPDGETLEKRWEGVTTVARKRKPRTWLDCVRLFLGRPQESVEFAEEFAGIFKDEDATFLLQDNDLEVRVLAGSAIAHKLKNTSAAADVGAMALTCAYFGGEGSEVPIPQVVSIARGYLDDRATEARRFRDGHTPDSPSSLGNRPFDGIAKQESYPRPGNWAQVKNQIGELVDRNNKMLSNAKKLQDSIDQLAVAISRNVMGQNVAGRIAALEEETNVLWWLFGERSRDLDETFQEVGMPGMIFLAGKEMSDLTKILPGPVSAKAILGRAISVSERDLPNQVEIGSAVEAVGDEWKKEWVGESETLREVKDLVPGLRAVRMSVENGDGWKSAYDQRLEVSSSTQLPPAELARQVYEECLFIRLIDES